MSGIEGRRRATVDRLGDAYAAGRLGTGSLELRVVTALEARGDDGLQRALWGLPDVATGLVRRGREALDALRGPATGLLLAGAPPLLVAPAGERQAWTVGRSSSSDVRLDHPSVSRRHARVAFRGGCWTVEDLGSSNGTLVNGVRVDRHELRRGDVVAFAAVNARLAWGP
jgi:hypothetical protein